ncbi:hypothetical protein ADINL_0043 [Nitrincola lacisaponensis]|uniref:Uncharacterized protein n=1 Tax=Nitrincola lacisaponensis TaxID=267850 RepID=A0A063Y4W4_9GAMM|nr:hypothetical protein [Nitrincola lacisaponensis]KDE41363.1 hypothetical protein ADINL_0043 [Nitrincola lacisaponensis]
MIFSIITSDKPATLTKTFNLLNGELQKGTTANLYEGSVSKVELESLHQFAELLKGLEHNQALCFGVPLVDGKLYSKKRFEELGKPAGAITRTADKFRWPAGAGFMLLDYDPAKQQQALNRDELLAQIRKAAPDIAAAGKVWFPSSSSHIHHGEEDLTGLKGQRLYLSVKDANDIPRAGAVLVQRLWLQGFGWYEVGAAGQLLERCTVDASVWQTNRLDFAAGAKCTPPLEQKRGFPIVTDGEPLDTLAALPDLTPEELAELASIKAAARREAEPEAQAAQQLYIDEKAAAMVPDDLQGEEFEQALRMAERIVMRALEQQVLTGDFPLILEGGESVTVGEVLDDPAEYHGKLTLDPIEPDYQGGKVTGKLYLIGSRPNLYSFAHGGRNFKLLRQPREIELIPGRRHDAIQTVLSTMRVLPDVFDMGAQMVTVDQGKAEPLDEQRFLFWLGGSFQFYTWKKRGDLLVKELIDPPAALAKQILALGAGRRLKALDAVITAPVMRPDGSILSKPGYDSKTRLLLDTAEVLPHVPNDPDPEAVRNALERLMMPFNSFPFAAAQDKGIMLAALLTAVMRPVLPTAPGFGFDAPVMGSGKTLLAECMGILATGDAPTVWPHTSGRDDEETRKRILTALRSGSRALIWDNVTGIFDSAALAALLTSSSFTDRVLGQSMEITVPNRSVLVLTGNNLTLAGDMPRRVLKCRIDPQTERPYARKFDLDPKEYVRANRMDMVCAALTIIKGWLQSPESMFGAGAPGRMASFEVWDDLVRQPVAWVAQAIAPGEYADPMDVVDQNQQSDPEQEALFDTLSEIHQAFGAATFTSKDLHKKAYGGDGFSMGVDSLKEALEDLASKTHLTTKGIGRVLTFRADRMVQGLALVKAGQDGHTKQQRWKIRQH